MTGQWFREEGETVEEKIYAAPERVDTNNAAKVEIELKNLVDEGVKDLVFDMGNMQYISSAGLRVLLSIQKKLSGKGTFTLINVPDAVREILDVTGFAGLLTIK